MSAQLFLFCFGQTAAQVSERERTPNPGKLDGIDPRAALLLALGESVMEFLPGSAFFDAGPNALGRKLTMRRRRRQVDDLSETPDTIELHP